jgi:hypothetical protein
LNRLLCYEVLGAVLCLLVLPVIASTHLLLSRVGIGFMYHALLVLDVACLFWQCLKVNNLARINFTKSLSHTLLHVNRYQIWIRKEKPVSVFLLFILMAVIMYMQARTHATLLVWFLSACVLAGVIFLTWYIYAKVYDKDFASIRRELEQLEELK